MLDEVGVQFVKRCIEVLESRGLEEQGIYRVVGVTSKVNNLLKMGLDRRKPDRLANLDDPQEWETKTITSALKSYLRNLPEPLMTHRFHNGFIAAVSKYRAFLFNYLSCSHMLLNVFCMGKHYPYTSVLVTYRISSTINFNAFLNLYLQLEKIMSFDISQ